MTIIAENILTHKEVIAGRAELIAVSKNQSDEKILQSLEAGQRIFGENKVQEARQHWEDKREFYPDLSLHLIGPLQSNKAKEAVALFDVIQTIDRESLIDALAKEEEKQNRRLTYFIQVNTGREQQKSGVMAEDLPALLNYARSKDLNVTGLMCIPPVDEEPRKHFALLKKLARDNGIVELSMGMSSDYEIALEEGASFVRIGTALFGER